MFELEWWHYLLGSTGTLIVALITGGLSKSLHGEKGYEGGFGIGFFLGVIGLIYAAGLPDRKGSKIVETEDGETLIVTEEDDDFEDAEEEIEEEESCSNKIREDIETENENVNGVTICEECGWQIFEEDETCPNCGKKVK